MEKKMQKFFVKTEQIRDEKIEIIGTDVNHIVNVLRLQVEDLILVCDQEKAKTFIAQIADMKKQSVFCKIIEEVKQTVEPNLKIDLFQGLPKADKMEWIIQKTTEIGVNAIIPVAMERSIVKISQKDGNKKRQRWQTIAEVAAKQSKRDKIPVIGEILSLKEITQTCKQYDAFIIAYEEETKQTLKQSLRKIQTEVKKIGVLVGPEGGIDPKEIDLLKEQSTTIVTLGKRILRTETAPIVLISNILYELEET